MKYTFCRALAITAIVSFPGWATAQVDDFIEQHVWIDLAATPMQIEIELTLDLGETASAIHLATLALPLASVDVDGTPVGWSDSFSDPGYITDIALPSQLPAGTQTKVHMVARGELDCASLFYPGYQWCVHDSHQTILPMTSAGEAWYLSSVFAFDQFVGSLTVVAPASQDVVSVQGTEEERSDNGDGTATWVFSFDYPTDGVGLYAGDMEAVTSETGFPVTGYVPSAHVTKMEHAVAIAAEVLDYYNELYTPMPADHAYLVTTPNSLPFGGMGLLGTIFLNEYVFWDEYAYIVEQGVAHEFGHTWWGHMSSGNHPFFTEAFAEYSAWRAMGHLYDDAMRTSGSRMNAVWYMYRRTGNADVAVLDPKVFNSPAYGFVIYHKGSTVLRTFEEAAGEAPFTAALRALVQSGPGHTDIDKFVSEIAASSGYDASADVEQWLLQPGFPHLEVRPAVATSATETTLALFALTDDPFAFNLPVRLTFADGTTRNESLTVGEDGSGHVVWGLEGYPVLVEFDPRWTMVREITPGADRAYVSFDGVVDGVDLIEVALRQGSFLPDERRVDGGYDPLYDLNGDGAVDGDDLNLVLAAAASH